MSVNSALAQAARRIRAANERLPHDCRVDVAVDWHALLDEVRDRPERRAIPLIEAWTRKMESRIARRLLRAPIEGQR